MIACIVALALGQSTDEMGILRKLGFSDKGTLSISIHEPIGPNDVVPPVKAFDPSFYKAGGNQPARFVFGADVDGDTVDEIVVIKEQLKHGGRYRLSVHAAPGFLSSDLGKPIASAHKDSLGSALTHGAIIGASSIDTDGDLVDELLLVRQASNGVQRIEVRKLPKKKHKELGPAIASYLHIGDAAIDPVVAAGSVDLDGDGLDEVTLVRAAGPLFQGIAILPAPLVPGDFTPVPLMSLQVVASSGEVLVADSVDKDNDGHDELLLLRRPHPAFDRLEVHRVNGPELLDGGTTVWSTILPEIGSAKTWSVLTLRGFSPKDLPDDFSVSDLAGDYECTLKFTVSQGYAGSDDVIAGPFDGPHGETDGFDLDLFVDDDSVISGPFSKDDMAVDFAPDQVTVKVGGDKLKVTFQPAKVFFLGKFIELRGTFTGHGVDDDGDKFPIGGGQYAFRHKLEG